MTRIRSDLPPDANEPIVSRVTTAGGALVTWSVASDNMSDTELSWFVDLTVTRELSAVPGIGRVTRVGGVVARDPRRSRSRPHGGARRDRERRVAAAARAFRPSTRAAKAASAGSSRPCARRAPSPPSTTCARCRSRCRTAAACGSTRSPTCATRPASSARRRCSTASPSSASRSCAPGARARSTWPMDARAVVEQLQQEYPHVQFAEASSTVGYIQESFDASMEMLVEGAILAIIVVWLFLRDWRATAVSADRAAAVDHPDVLGDLGARLHAEHSHAARAVARRRHPRRRRDRRGREHRAALAHGQEAERGGDGRGDRDRSRRRRDDAHDLSPCSFPVAFMSGIAGEFFRPVRLHRRRWPCCSRCSSRGR